MSSFYSLLLLLFLSTTCSAFFLTPFHQQHHYYVYKPATLSFVRKPTRVFFQPDDEFKDLMEEMEREKAAKAEAAAEEAAAEEVEEEEADISTVEHMAAFLSVRLGRAFINHAKQNPPPVKQQVQEEEEKVTTKEEEVVVAVEKKGEDKEQAEEKPVQEKVPEEQKPIAVPAAKDETVSVEKETKLDKEENKIEVPVEALADLESTIQQAADEINSANIMETPEEKPEANGVPETSDQERGASLHKREGDRVVALQDEFSTDAVPGAISNEFGRPLEVIESGVPPLSSDLNDTVNLRTATAAVNSSPSSLDATATFVENEFTAASPVAVTPPDKALEEMEELMKLTLSKEMSLEDQAFVILVELGMVQIHPDPSSPNYDATHDDEYCPENVYVNFVAFEDRKKETDAAATVMSAPEEKKESAPVVEAASSKPVDLIKETPVMKEQADAPESEKKMIIPEETLQEESKSEAPSTTTTADDSDNRMSLQDRAFATLVDLGMIQRNPSNIAEDDDDAYCPENVYANFDLSRI